MQKRGVLIFCILQLLWGSQKFYSFDKKLETVVAFLMLILFWLLQK